MKKPLLHTHKHKKVHIIWCFFLVLSGQGCQSTDTATKKASSEKSKDSIRTEVINVTTEDIPPEPPPPPGYHNDRFRNVLVTKTGTHEYRVTGEAQVFEAAFSWFIKEGDREIIQGHDRTDAGAPLWGKFAFTVRPKEVAVKDSLYLVLYEASAKDGSRQHQLRIPLFR